MAMRRSWVDVPATANLSCHVLRERYVRLARFDAASWGAKLKGEGREWKRHFRYLPS